MQLIVIGNKDNILAKQLADNLKTRLLDIAISRYDDGEVKINLSAEDIYLLKQSSIIIIVQFLFPQIHDQLMELLLISNTIKKIKPIIKIIALIPYLAYSRQRITLEIKNSYLYPINFLTEMCYFAGINNIITIDFHRSYNTTDFMLPVYNLTSTDILLPILKKYPDIILVSPDFGRGSYVKFMAEILKVPYVIINKNRSSSNKITMNLPNITLINKNCFIIDDILDSGNTLLMATNLLLERGATSINAYITHLLANNTDSLYQITNMISKIYYSDSTKHFIPKTESFLQVSLLKIIEKFIVLSYK